MIYIVDEDANEMEPYVNHLNLAGFEATVIENADDAYEVLTTSDNIEAIVLDVMLATRKTSESRFSAINTNNFITTGLKLLDDLVDFFKENGSSSAIPSKVVFFSAATRVEVVSKIEKKAEEHKISYLNKIEYDDVDEFVDHILETIRVEQ